MKNVKTNTNYIHSCTMVWNKIEYLTGWSPSTADRQHRVMMGPWARSSAFNAALHQKCDILSTLIHEANNISDEAILQSKLAHLRITLWEN